MSRSRRDYPRYLGSLGLLEGADDWVLLARSHGRREGDRIRVYAEPAVSGSGRTTATFFAHGVGRRLRDDARVEPILLDLSPGRRLQLAEEPDDTDGSDGLLIGTGNGARLGYVPAVLLDYVSALRAHGEPGLLVERVNGRDEPPGYRLLVTLSGRVHPGYQPFAGEKWALHEVAGAGAATSASGRR